MHPLVSLDLARTGCKLGVQIQTDPRCFSFVERARPASVLGLGLPAATLEDIRQGKIWSAQDLPRRPSKRRRFSTAMASALVQQFANTDRKSRDGFGTELVILIQNDSPAFGIQKRLFRLHGKDPNFCSAAPAITLCLCCQLL